MFLHFSDEDIIHTCTRVYFTSRSQDQYSVIRIFTDYVNGLYSERQTENEDSAKNELNEMTNKCCNIFLKPHVCIKATLAALNCPTVTDTANDPILIIVIIITIILMPLAM